MNEIDSVYLWQGSRKDRRCRLVYITQMVVEMHRGDKSRKPIHAGKTKPLQCHGTQSERCLKTLIIVVAGFFMTACVMDSEILQRDDTARVRNLGEERAHADLACPNVKAGRPVRSDRMTDWGEPLFSEYRTWVEGCGKHITYVIACHEDDECVFSDTLGLHAE